MLKEHCKPGFTIWIEIYFSRKISIQVITSSQILFSYENYSRRNEDILSQHKFSGQAELRFNMSICIDIKEVPVFHFLVADHIYLINKHPHNKGIDIFMYIEAMV